MEAIKKFIFCKCEHQLAGNQLIKHICSDTYNNQSIRVNYMDIFNKVVESSLAHIQ